MNKFKTNFFIAIFLVILMFMVVPGQAEVNIYSELTINAGNSLVINPDSTLSFYRVDGSDTHLSNIGTISIYGYSNHMGILQADTSRLVITGTGNIVLNGESAFLSAWSSGSMLQESGHTIRGFGSITAPFVNRGNIIAEGGVLNISTDILDNQSGVLSAQGSSSTLQFFGPNIKGGIIRSTDGNIIFNAAILSNVTLDAASSTTGEYGATFKGENTLTSNTHLTASGLRLTPDGGTAPVLINNGVIELKSNTRLVSDGVVSTLSGKGTVLMSGDNVQVTNSGSGSFVNDVDHTIKGKGSVYTELTNKGNILAQGGALSFSGPVTNYGILTADQDATLTLGGLTNLGDGKITGVVGSTIDLGYVSGGLIASAGNVILSGIMKNLTLDAAFSTTGEYGTTFKGENTLTSNTHLTASGLRLTPDGGTAPVLINNGVIELKSNARLVSDGTISTLSGKGTILMSGDNVQIVNSGSGSFVNDVGHTIKGHGVNYASIENNGAIIAEGGTFHIGSITGTGTMKVADDSKLSMGANLETGDLIVASKGALEVYGAVEVHGNFLYAANDKSLWNWSSGSILKMSGQGPAWHYLEAGGSDFVIPNLIITGNIALVDYFDNTIGESPEALYVDHLSFEGSTLNLNDLSLFLSDGHGGWNQVFVGDFGGKIIDSPVPVPPTLVLLGSGLLGLIGIRRLRKG